MYKLSYEKCVCFIFLVILVILSCSGFHTDRLVTLTDHNSNKKYPFTSSSYSSINKNENAQHDYNDFITRMILSNRADAVESKRYFARGVHFAGVPGATGPSRALPEGGDQRHHQTNVPQQRRNRRHHLRWAYERRRKRRNALLHTKLHNDHQQEQQQQKHVQMDPQAELMPYIVATKYETTNDLVRSRYRRGIQPGEKRKRNDKFCPGQDVATRAYYAKIIIEGRVRSKLNTNVTTKYGVTVEVKKIHKNESKIGANITEMLRLHFAVGKRKGCENKLVHGLVKADLENGKDYIFFLDCVGMHNYTVSGQPVPYNFKKIQKIRDVVKNKKVRSTRISKQLKNKDIRRESNIVLVCGVKGFPPPIITWYKEGHKIWKKNNKHRIKFRKNESTLIVQRAEFSDAGRYECRAKGVDGITKSSFAQITVSEIEKRPPTIITDTEGQPCSSPQKEEFCLNGGTCISYKSIGEIACRCENGYNGMRCESKDVTNTSMYMPSSCKLGLSNSYYC